MKILLVNTFDTIGGPGRWVYLLHQNLLKEQIDSKYIVDKKFSNDDTVIGTCGKIGDLKSRVKQVFDCLPLLFYPNWKKVIFSTGFAPFDINRLVDKLKPDIVHLNWVNRGFISTKSLSKIRVPIVWTMVDMWLFTGGCHYDEECGRYKVGCGQCPILGSNKTKDLSFSVLNKKKKYWANNNLTVVASSHWLYDCAKSSELFKNARVEEIPIGINLETFIPVNKDLAREKLFLPHGKKLVLFGAVNAVKDKRKGFNYLIDALKKLDDKKNEIELVVFGSSFSKEVNNCNLKVNYLGHINDDKKMSQIYSAADVFVAPSIQDNMPTTVMESLACGTPAVAFDVGGMSSMVEHKKNGYLSKLLDVDDLANGIKWVINQVNYDALSENSRKKIEDEFDIKNITKKYIDLYNNILDK